MSAGPETGLIPKNVVAEMVGYRNQAIAAYERYFDALENAKGHLAAAEAAIVHAAGNEYRTPYSEKHGDEIESFKTATRLPDSDRMKSTARRLTDVVVWGAIIARTDLDTLMDKQAKDELRKAMEFVPERVDPESGRVINQQEIDRSLPQVTEDNVFATLDQFQDQAGEIWRRGVANAFSKLDRRFRSHDGFSIGSRIILSNAFSDWGTWCYHRNHRDTLIDIERVFLVLDGKTPKCDPKSEYSERSGDENARAGYVSIVEKIDAARQRFGRRQGQHEGEYFGARIFKNGNMHLWFRRPDLVKKVNLLLAEHYGAALGYGKGGDEDPEQSFSGAVTRAPAKNWGMFPTPDELAERVVEHECGITSETPLMILEPSAGTGQLSKRLVEPAYSGCSYEWREKMAPRHRVTVVEVQAELVETLRQDGRYAAVRHADFLALTPEPIYDRVVMNPPFDRGRDIDHVHHALQFLKPGGSLVAIMSASTEFSETPRAKAFREKVESLRGHFTDLPEGSFREAGTNVNTVLLKVRGGL